MADWLRKGRWFKPYLGISKSELEKHISKFENINNHFDIKTCDSYIILKYNAKLSGKMYKVKMKIQTNYNSKDKSDKTFVITAEKNFAHYF